MISFIYSQMIVLDDFHLSATEFQCKTLTWKNYLNWKCHSQYNFHIYTYHMYIGLVGLEGKFSQAV